MNRGHQLDRVKELEAEVERLRAMHVEAFEEEADKLRAENERLRTKYETLLEIEDYALEVERLRAALDQIAHIDHMRLGWGEELQRIARTALGEEEA